MKIQHQIVSLGVVGAVFVALVGLSGLLATKSIQSSLDDALGASVSLSESQTIGTLLDSVRGLRNWPCSRGGSAIRTV